MRKDSICFTIQYHLQLFHIHLEMYIQVKRKMQTKFRWYCIRTLTRNSLKSLHRLLNC